MRAVTRTALLPACTPGAARKRGRPSTRTRTGPSRPVRSGSTSPARSPSTSRSRMRCVPSSAATSSSTAAKAARRRSPKPAPGASSSPLAPAWRRWRSGSSAAFGRQSQSPGEARPARRRHAEDPEADRLREARRHARELEELEAAHVEVRHLAEERAERGAQPAHETVHHQLEAREPAAQVALLAGEVEPPHAARGRAAAVGDGAFADAAQEGVDLLLGENAAHWTMNSVK